MQKLKSRNLAKFCAYFIDKKKCKDTVLLNVSKLTTICDYLIISSVESTVQMSAVINELISTLKKKNIYPFRTEGGENSNWVVMDYGTVVIHLMFPDIRRYYLLDRIWSAGRKLKYDKK